MRSSRHGWFVSPRWPAASTPAAIPAGVSARVGGRSFGVPAGVHVGALLLALSAVAGTVWICVPGWRSAWIIGLGLAWGAPGVLAMRRAYRDSRSRWPMALLLGSPVGFALSSICLLTLRMVGAGHEWALIACPLAAAVVAWLTPSLGRHVDVPRYDRRDVLAVALVLCLVPLVVARPYARVGEDLPEGRAYRAYFTADFVWAMAVVSEVSKGDGLPANPYHIDMPLHYYWLAHLFPALEHRALGRQVRLDHLLLGNAVLAGSMFVAFLYGLAKQFARGAMPALLGTVVAVLFTSPEGAYALAYLWWYEQPLSLVRYLNIDAISRWMFDALPIDGLHRLLLYQPQHQIGYALACTSLLVVVQQVRRPTLAAAAVSGALLGAALLVSTFSALMVGCMIALVGIVSTARTPDWRLATAQLAIGAIPLAIAVWVSRRLGYVAGGGPLVDVVPNALAVQHPISGPVVSLGPVLLALGVAGWLWARRRGRGRTRVLLPGAALVVCVFFYFFVDVRDHQDVYVGWRVGHLLLITAAGVLGWTWWRLLHASARRWSVAGVAGAVAMVLITAPTVAIDLYNVQDLANRAMAAGFRWTLVLSHDDLNALRWIATNTPRDARVQVDPLARDPGTWAYVPAFGERRMSAGLPISMIPLAPYRLASQRVSRLYDATDAADLTRALEAWRVDVLVVGPEERARHPHIERVLDGAPQAFPALYRTRTVTLYAASDRLRERTRRRQ